MLANAYIQNLQSQQTQNEKKHIPNLRAFTVWSQFFGTMLLYIVAMQKSQ